MATPRRLPRASRPLLFAAALSLTLPASGALATRPLYGQDRQFPYEATVRVDGAYVRSGPGKSYYPTDRLARGSRLSVHRHDPGGWFMVAPPPGSFSWIRAEHVQYTNNSGAGRGVVQTNNVVVRVGSTFGDETREVEQIRLSKGDEVTIIEQKTLQTEQGPIAFLKVAPPPGEYRWIAGQDVTAVDAVVRREHDRNPFMTPSSARPDHAPVEQPDPFAGRRPPTPANDGPIAATERRPRPSYDESVYEPRTVAKGSPQGLAVNHSGPDPAVLSSQRERLDELDTEFREMVARPTGEWEFTRLEQGYRQLQEQSALPALANQIELRFDALARYRKIKTEYDDLMRLTNEARRRDAELLSLQSQSFDRMPQSIPSQIPSQPSIPEQPTTPFAPGGLQPEPDPLATQPAPSQDGWVPSGQPGGQLGGRAGGAPLEPSPSRPSSPLAGDPSASPQPPQFDGAGIVQRTQSRIPGLPQHVLIAPGGRVLTYLQGGPGVNLDLYVGQSLGLTGQRYYRQDLRSDFMIVHSLTPVRLIP